MALTPEQKAAKREKWLKEPPVKDYRPSPVRLVDDEGRPIKGGKRRNRIGGIYR